jgi:hypothetical protein
MAKKAAVESSGGASVPTSRLDSVTFMAIIPLTVKEILDEQIARKLA